MKSNHAQYSLDSPFLRTEPEAEFLRQILVFGKIAKVTLLSTVSRSGEEQQMSGINISGINESDQCRASEREIAKGGNWRYSDTEVHRRKKDPEKLTLSCLTCLPQLIYIKRASQRPSSMLWVQDIYLIALLNFSYVIVVLFFFRPHMRAISALFTIRKMPCSLSSHRITSGL